MLKIFKIKVRKMKVRYLRDWHEINRGDVQELSEFDVIHLQDLGVVEKFHARKSEIVNRTPTLHCQKSA